MKSQGFFLVFVLSITLGLQYANSLFKHHFSDEKDLGRQIHSLKKVNAEKEIQLALEKERLQDLQYFALKSIGEKKVKTWEDQQWQIGARSPASIPVANYEIKSQALLEKAKLDFQEKRYDQSVSLLKSFIEKYPLSSEVVQSHFLLAESYYLNQKIEESLDVIDRMMTLYPDSELTGFIMLRMGQILEKKNRRDEAVAVYQTVAEQFPENSNLQEQVQIRLYHSSQLQ